MIAGLLLFIIFASYLRSHLAREHASWLVGLFYGGAILFVAAIFVFVGIQLAMDALEDPAANPEIAKTFFIMQERWLFVAAPGIIAMAGAAGAMSLRFRALPVWLGGLAILVAIGGVIPFIGLLLLIPWLAAVSVTLLVQDFRAT